MSLKHTLNLEKALKRPHTNAQRFDLVLCLGVMRGQETGDRTKTKGLGSSITQRRAGEVRREHRNEPRRQEKGTEERGFTADRLRVKEISASENSCVTPPRVQDAKYLESATSQCTSTDWVFKE